MNVVASQKERYLIWLALVVLISCYFVFNYIAQNSAPHPTVAMDWEKNIPFIALFVVPYQSLYFNVLILFILLRKRIELWVLMLRMFFVLLFSYTFFLCVPLEYTFSRPNIDSNWFITWLFFLLDANDLPYNQLPSLHISTIVVYWYMLRGFLKNIWLKQVVFLWFFLIGLSTLFIYQHHFWDVVTGLLLGLTSVWIFSVENITKIKRLRRVKQL